MALHKAGIDSVVYEEHSIGADDVSVILTLASNGIDALRVLEAHEPALAAGFPTPRITLRSKAHRQAFDYHIDWDDPANIPPSVTNR